MALSQKTKVLAIGISSSIILLAIFVTVILVSVPLEFAAEEFSRLWYWVLILATGFGFQVGLFTHVRLSVHEKMRGETASVAATGAISTGSMVACCSHAIVNILPLIGVSAAAVFLATFQLPLILLGVFSNLVGITVMLGVVQKHELAGESVLLNTIVRYDMKKLRNIMIAISIAAVASAFMVTSAMATGGGSLIAEGLSSESDRAKGVTVSVAPQDVYVGTPVAFKIGLSTHSVDLTYELTEIATLEDNMGNTYQPAAWAGDPPGGHHRSGVLTFPFLKDGAKSMKLTLRGIAGVPERVFEWKF